MIPKVIYQTWKTKQLHSNIQDVRTKLQQLNSEYTIVLFDDSEMDTWMKVYTSKDVQGAYNSLAVGAARADLWRYCILYKNGGVYLDIDSTILTPLDELIASTDQAVISRERNRRRFLQWCMAFEKGHPILKAAIDNAVKNIQSKSSTNISELTGPIPFSKAVNELLLPYYSVYSNLWYQPDDRLNEELNIDSAVRCKFIGTDFVVGTTVHALWKHTAADYLYLEQPHWLSESVIFKSSIAVLQEHETTD